MWPFQQIRKTYLKPLGYLTLYGLLCHTYIQAQYSPPNGIYADLISDEKIKTVLLHKPGWETSYPIGHVDDETPLMLMFDDLSDVAKRYSYTITHCDADWRQSRLMTSEYMDGFPSNPIRNYTYSFNTLIPYVHYKVALNEDINLKVSGNFVIQVFEDGAEDHPVCIKRFSITESLAVISAVANRAKQTTYQNEFQQVDFTVRTANYPIENPYQEVKIVILKNGQWHTALTGLKPLFVRQNELDYRHEKATLFPAGNEYRPLDTKSNRYTSTRMKNIEYKPPTYHFYPYPDEDRSTMRYQYIEDFNGAYVVQTEKSNNPAVEADYVYVHFTLSAREPFDDGQVYVSGAFTNYAYTRDNLMTYNPDKSQYEATILLKQGYYNYIYAFLPFKGGKVNDTLLEGNFYDTENNYNIYVYHRGRASRYDRLIGVSVVNTLNK